MLGECMTIAAVFGWAKGVALGALSKSHLCGVRGPHTLDDPTRNMALLRSTLKGKHR